MRGRCRLLSVCSISLVVWLSVNVCAQTPEPAAQPEKSAPADAAEPTLEAKREAVARRLAVAQKTLESATATSDAKEAQPPEQLVSDVELLKQREIVLGQQKAAEDQIRELSTTQADLKAKLARLEAGIFGEEPASFLLLDRLRDELATEKARTESFTAAVAEATSALSRAGAIQGEKEKKRRQAKDALDGNKDSTATPVVGSAYRRADAEHHLAAETARLRELELKREKLAQQNQKLRLTCLQRQVEQLGKDVQFTSHELTARLDEIAKEEEDLKQAVAAADRNLSSLEGKWIDQRHALDLSSRNQPGLIEEVESLRLARYTRQQEISVLNQRLERLGKMRTAWRRRFDVVTRAADGKTLFAWEVETRQAIEQLGQESRLQAIRVDALREDLAAVERKLQASKEQPVEAAREIAIQRDHLQELSRVYDSNFVSVDTCRRLHDKLASEIRQDVRTASLAEHALHLGQHMLAVWNYELITVEQSAITVGKVIVGMVLLAIGYFASGFLSRWFGKRLLPRLGMNDSAAAALQSLAFYALVATFALLALRILNVPLTVFTFLGGAVAIGVGFGSQNIVNNFISGLILLAERPIRVGDLIEINSLCGTVAKIGARSTRVTTSTNLEIIIPNSTLLQNNVINFTLSDDQVRTHVNVGVTYGSSTRDVAHLLKKAADEHGQVERDPEPFVWLTEFGDNALQFELHFWIKLRSHSVRQRIESDLRHKIDTLFREAGISMAFPQRDIHLDVARPISVRVLPADAPRAEQEPIRKAAA